MTRPNEYVGKGIPMVTAGRFTRSVGRVPAGESVGVSEEEST